MEETEQKRKHDLETKPLGKLMFRLALPTVVAQLVNLLYNIVDRVFVGRLPEVGDLALAGLGITFPIIMMISAFFNLFGLGGSSRAAISYGAKDIGHAEKLMGNSASMLIVSAVVIMPIVYIFKDSILLLFGASVNTLPFASDYLNIYLVGTVFVLLSMGLNMFISCQGNARMAMVTVVIGAVVNLVLDPIFIFVFDMGVRGAALATVISQGISAVWVISFLMSKKSALRLRLKNMIPEFKIVKSIVILGVSPFIMMFTECVVQLIFNRGMLTYGNDDYVALMSVLFSLMQLIWMPLSGIAQGATPIIGYNYGARKIGRVKKAFTLLLTVDLIFSTIVVIFVELFPAAFLGIFTDKVHLIEMGITPMRVYMSAMFLMGALSACQQTFLALSEAKSSMIVALLRKVVLLIPLALILPLVMENAIWGLFLAEPISDVASVTITIIMFAVFYKKKIATLKDGDSMPIPDEEKTM